SDRDWSSDVCSSDLLSLLLGASRQDRVLERHDEEREALAFVLIRCEELEPALAPRRVDDELARNGAHEHQDEAVAKEPVGHPQRDPRHAEDLEGQAVARVVMQRRRQATVTVKLFRLELVQREDHRKALAPEREERPNER